MIEIELKKENGEVIYTYSCENNSIRTTLEHAVEEREDLSELFLIGADLRGAELCSAILPFSKLYRCDLRGANLSGANFTGSDLSLSQLQGSKIVNAYFSKTNLHSCYMAGCSLVNTNLTAANLTGVNLAGADLRQADLKEANLMKAYLKGVTIDEMNLCDANLHGMVGLDYQQCTYMNSMGRPETVTKIMINNKPYYYCGDFQGDENSFKKHINDIDPNINRYRDVAITMMKKFDEKS